ncbi:unnamed protein product [Durusdinium trenchii]|uniref:Uncharacterized protein n=2 Tax=Durusdinium trenchii TaxID=1381693 RepID=A0ABP0SMN2_9DINO
MAVEDFLPSVEATQLVVRSGEGFHEDFPSLHQLLEYEEPCEVCRAILRLMRRLLCRRSEVSEAAMVEREGLLPWIHEWLEMSQEERLALTKIAVNGFTALTVQMQARHLALLIDIQLAHMWVEHAFRESESQESSRTCSERVARGARVYRTLLAALAVLPDTELDSIGQAAAAELQAAITPISMARVVLRLSATRRRQLMDILVEEQVLEEGSALRLFRALSALESMMGADALDAVLTGMDAAASASAGILSVGSGVLAAGAGVLDSVTSISTTRPMQALGAWSYDSLFGEDGGDQVLENEAENHASQEVPDAQGAADFF